MSASPTMTLPPGIPATNTETEQEILGAVEEAVGGQERAEALWQLVFFYQEQANRSDLAVPLLELIIRESDDPENTAIAYYTLGHIEQTSEKWAEALLHYEKGLSLSPRHLATTYFLYNDAGCCLNSLGLYESAKRYCRRAIEVNAKAPNAFKNLGVSLYGQGDLKGAAWCWEKAIKVNPSDPRAAELLDQLLAKHPALKSECPWIHRALKPLRKTTRG